MVRDVVSVLGLNLLKNSEFICEDLICRQLVKLLQGVPHMARSLARPNVHQLGICDVSANEHLDVDVVVIPIVSGFLIGVRVWLRGGSVDDSSSLHKFERE